MADHHRLLTDRRSDQSLYHDGTRWVSGAELAEKGSGPVRIRTILERQFGPVAVAYQPGDVPHGFQWPKEWRAEPVGICSRPACPWPAHTSGPDGRPWHPFCWMVPTEGISRAEARMAGA